VEWQYEERLRSSRPTAVNLSWALDRLRPLWNQGAIRLLAEATAIEAEDLEMNRMIGFHGSALIPKGAGILTICNTGSLATAGHGTALGIIRSAFAQDPTIHVYSCETRPRQQGLRITAYELLQEAIPFHSIADGAAAFLMAKGKVQVVVVGADRIAANGDTANKIGTYMLAVVAAHHRIPFLVAAPSSTIDASLSDGHAIPIEERDAEELTHVEGVQVAPAGCPVWNPAFDLTPGSLINAIVTESGVNRPPYSFVDS
jgi:methylthioribose-1-phosphate isomerase